MAWYLSSSLFPTPSSHFGIISLTRPCLYQRAGVSVLCLSQSQVSVVNGRTNGKVVRLGLPSKGRMADETLELLKVNPGQYVTEIPQVSLYFAPILLKILPRKT